jgi:hypothetical protein
VHGLQYLEAQQPEKGGEKKENLDGKKIPCTKKKQPQTLQGAQQNLADPPRLQGGASKKKSKFDLGVLIAKTPGNKPFMPVHRTGYSGSAVFESPAKRDVA